nr:recombinase family protein [Prosthecochloris vibrioformis]
MFFEHRHLSRLWQGGVVFWYEIPLSSEFFDELGVVVRFLDGGINTEGTMGKMVVTIFSAFAQFGRKWSIKRKKVLALKEQDLGATDIARQMNIGRSTVYVILQNPK